MYFTRVLSALAIVAFTSKTVVSGTPTSGPNLSPRTSPVPCVNRYVCPTPLPYPNTPNTGDDPDPHNFKCRIGSSAGDPNFAFCIYDKVSAISLYPSLLVPERNNSRVVLTNVELTVAYGRPGRVNTEWNPEHMLGTRPALHWDELDVGHPPAEARTAPRASADGGAARAGPGPSIERFATARRAAAATTTTK